jgi:hypothetical protein
MCDFLANELGISGNSKISKAVSQAEEAYGVLRC